MFRSALTSILILLLPLVAAFTLNPPTQALNSGSVYTITWTTVSTDPATFDLRLVNDAFHNTFALKASIQSSDGSVTLLLPEVQPGAGYSFQATAIGNVNSVLGTAGPLTIGAPLSSSLPSGSTPLSTPVLTTTSGVVGSSAISSKPTLSGSGTVSSAAGSVSPTSTPFNGASSMGLGGFTGAFAVAAAAAGAALAAY